MSEEKVDLNKKVDELEAAAKKAKGSDEESAEEENNA